ncbi:hypothetical protein LOTGIDRAFT_162876 [Lottia gigantea]|uniref:Uncharacterized protein n=1 Tax=Lottia gigantea TaxID=225164 RepID=V4A667_LOTGI|nr:hypothetical protein LOTGIDRAFT_162876 [Lottia gigantea]ESO92222.1 hypothetical protein LOTGIDRAFT_162876 [Lottia gigantea]
MTISFFRQVSGNIGAVSSSLFEFTQGRRDIITVSIATNEPSLLIANRTSLFNFNNTFYMFLATRVDRSTLTVKGLGEPNRKTSGNRYLKFKIQPNYHSTPHPHLN